MSSLRLATAVLPAAAGVVLAVACATQAVSTSASGHSPGSGGASSSSSSRASSGGTAGACASPMETFGVCQDGKPLDAGGGTSTPGEACKTDADCALVCCLCPEGQDQYAYGACSCGQCTSVCDPINDYRAPVCLDAGPVMTGCMKCSQILNEAWSDGDQLGMLACQGAAASSWNALANCAGSSCGSSCDGGVMPTNPCVICVESQDDAGGCASELSACQHN